MQSHQMYLPFFTEQDRVTVVEQKIEELSASSTKVRKKVFGEIASLKALIKLLVDDNAELRRLLSDLTGKRSEWSYLQDDHLFSLKDL